MRKLIVFAALTLAGASAQAADSYSFKIGGRSIHIEVPTQCNDLSCVSIALPAEDTKPGGAKGPKITTTPNNPNPVDARPAPAPVATPMAPAAAPAPTPSVAAAPAANDVAIVNPPVAERTPDYPAPAAPPNRPAVVSVAPADQRAAPPAPAAPAVVTPVGIWATEKNEGKVRIEPCGQNLCGYTVEGNAGGNGKQVLIDMKPGKGNVWNGKIHDVKNGGIYTSNISLQGRNALRVEGCAMGGMLCGGQTWARLE
jgi:uncharacterized protein (DUF2147 family)